MTTQINLNQAAHLVATCGTDTTFIFQGEPGIGKSAMLKVIAEQTNLTPRYVDCTLLDLGDIQMPKVYDDHVSFVPNSLFTATADQTQPAQPLVIMLDEIGKAMRPVQNALLTLLLEHRIGTHKLPEGSIVFGTTNLTTDGVGDQLQAHARNRVAFLKVQKPNAQEWRDWAAANDIDPAVTAWVQEYPHCLASYTDDPENTKDNPYIYHPQIPRAAFVTPRSLEKASNITRQRANLPENTLIAALSGTIGESAARDMSAFLQIGDSLPKWGDIMAHPETTAVPENAIACTILCHAAVQRLINSDAPKDDTTAWLKFMERMPKEVQFLFVTMAKAQAGLFLLLAKTKQFTAWVKENHWAY
jgi:hypothetical protein